MSVGELNINEQYRSALRTRSYQDMLEQIQEQLRALGHEAATKENNNNTAERREEQTGEEDPRGRDSETRPATHLNLSSNFLLPELDGQALPRSLLRDYHDSGLKASELCFQLLESIAGARENNRAVQRIVEQRGDGAHLWDLARIARLDNPLSQPRLAYFVRHHGDSYASMVPRLRSLRSGFAGFGQGARRRRSLDEAARGAYGLHREFDTVGRQLARLNDEIEHGKRVARTLLRGGGHFSRWRDEVARELKAGEGRLVDQLQELEERVHLCLLTIARAWKLLTQGLHSPPTTKKQRWSHHGEKKGILFRI